MWCRGVRGATTADANTSAAVLKATRESSALMIRQNEIHQQDVASMVFSTTTDLDAEFPALAARQLAWRQVPLICCHEIDVPDSLRLCIRILLHWNTEKSQEDIHHVYIKGAVSLRPDLADVPPMDWEELDQWISEHLDDEAQPGR